jgi:DNA-3-methyladenine glycosylase II
LKHELLHHIPKINDDLAYLVFKDTIFKKHKPNLEEFSWPFYGPGFDSLCRIVCGQQVSTAAAKSIWYKFDQFIPDKSPEVILSLNEENLMQCGLSQRKTSYIKGLAQTIVEGNLDLDALGQEPDDIILTKITSLRGFGRWSAELYLMFCLARPNIWPAGDLGIQYGLQYYLNLSSRPDETIVRDEQYRFSPRCTAASLLLWYLKSKTSA